MPTDDILSQARAYAAWVENSGRAMLEVVPSHYALCIALIKANDILDGIERHANSNSVDVQLLVQLVKKQRGVP